MRSGREELDDIAGCDFGLAASVIQTLPGQMKVQLESWPAASTGERRHSVRLFETGKPKEATEQACALSLGWSAGVQLLSWFADSSFTDRGIVEWRNFFLQSQFGRLQP